MHCAGSVTCFTSVTLISSIIASIFTEELKVKPEEIPCLFIGLFSDDESFLEFWKIRLIS